MHPGSAKGVFRKIGRQAERGAVPAGGTYHPALGRPDRRPGHYEPDVRDDSLNGFRSRHRMFPMSANLKWAKSGKPDFASGSAQVRFGIRKMPRWSAERRAPYVTGRGTPRHGVQTCRVMARYGAAIRTSASRRSAPSRGDRDRPHPRRRKLHAVKRSVGCLTP